MNLHTHRLKVTATYRTFLNCMGIYITANIYYSGCVHSYLMQTIIRTEKQLCTLFFPALNPYLQLFHWPEYCSCSGNIDVGSFWQNIQWYFFHDACKNTLCSNKYFSQAYWNYLGFMCKKTRLTHKYPFQPQKLPQHTHSDSHQRRPHMPSA